MKKLLTIIAVLFTLTACGQTELENVEPINTESQETVDKGPTQKAPKLDEVIGNWEIIDTTLSAFPRYLNVSYIDTAYVSVNGDSCHLYNGLMFYSVDIINYYRTHQGQVMYSNLLYLIPNPNTITGGYIGANYHK